MRLNKLKWVISGGYSGSEQRLMLLSRARRLRDECKQYAVAFFMKQLGSVYARQHRLHNWKGEDITEFPPDLQMQVFPYIPPLKGIEITVDRDTYREQFTTQAGEYKEHEINDILK